MRAGAPPLRFLVAAVGGWILVRALVLVPDWGGARPEAPAPVRIASISPAAPAALPMAGPKFRPHSSAALAFPVRSRTRAAYPAVATSRASEFANIAPQAISATASAISIDQPQPAPSTGPVPVSLTPPFPPALGAPREQRWSGSAWLLVREEANREALAPGGALGGSQAGLRVLYRLDGGDRRPLALSGRLYAPLDHPEGAEAAVGLDWRPLPSVPLNILAERRQKLGADGRSDFALTVYGGVADRPLAAGLKLDAYAQAGLVGIPERDAFADAAVRIAAPVGPVEIGAGAWAAAQPGVSRLDAGPQLRWRLPVGAANLSLSAEYRFRLAGDAEPGSGPALTIAADF